MFKYFKRQKSRRESVDNDCVGGGYDETDAQKKRHSLRSTSSFCDEVLLDELSLAEKEMEGCSGSDVAGGSSLSLSVGVDDEDAFKYHSRLAMSLPAIVNDPNCLSYFVQYLETRQALPLIKFYLDTENFKISAMTHLQKKQKNPEEQNKLITSIDESIVKQEEEEKEGEEEDNNSVPELKTLCDLSMRKPLTDDEKSQIYAETNKQITKCNNNHNNHNNNINHHKQRTCFEMEATNATASAAPLELDCSDDFVADEENPTHISAASIRDAMTIYQKYLIAHAPLFLCLPVAILSQISLLLCKRADDRHDAGSISRLRAAPDDRSISANCFDEAQCYILQQLERDYCNDFRQSTFYYRYCVELIEGDVSGSGGSEALNIYDILYSEATTLFFFMEFLEQQGERDCFDFWTTAINYRKSFSAAETDRNEAQSDAMIIYEKFFSLQSDCRLWMSSQRLRCHVEERICTLDQRSVAGCFDLPLQIVAKYLKAKYLRDFLKSQLFANYLNELKLKIHEELAIGTMIKETLDANTPTTGGVGGIHKLSLRRGKATTRHRKTLSDCTSESTRAALLPQLVSISQQNTLLAMESNTSSTTPTGALQSQKHQQQLHTPPMGSNLNIDAHQLTNPNLLWHRSGSVGEGVGGGLNFGRVNSLGRYERDFDALESGSNIANKHNWSLTGNRIKNAMRKLVNLPEDQMQEEIAWQVAEMIVKDVTSVTLRNNGSAAPTSPP